MKVLRIAPVLLLVVGLLIVGLGTTGAQSDQLVFSMVSHGGVGNPFWIVVIKGMDDACALLDADCAWLADPVDNVDDMAGYWDDALARNPDGIGTTVPNAEVIRDGVVRANEAGIPVIVFNTADPNQGTPDALDVLFYVGASEFRGGQSNARRVLAEAAADGVEIVGSHGYLPAQFLSQSVNVRTDKYGGSDENRLRFIKDVIAAIRKEVGDKLALGLRISIDEKNSAGMTEHEALQAIAALNGELDYVSIVAGTSATYQGATHIVPSMDFEHGYTTSLAARAKAHFKGPVIVTGRINQPQIAEEVIKSGEADLCGMTRAMICDPEMPNKAKANDIDDIRACIGCNQACIGHVLKGVGVSCLQHPETGRELEYGDIKAAPSAKNILVVGGGPAGMKAASIAASRGHQVTLMEREARLGGQALRAYLLPGREEFGGLVTNLTREVERAGVNVINNQSVDLNVIDRHNPDEIILACGAKPYMPAIEGAEEAHIVDAWQVLDGTANIGSSVLIADWTSDWVALGIAEKLARDGCRVRLAVTGASPGEVLQQYIKNRWNSVLLGLGIEVIPYTRIFGADANTVYLERTVISEHVVVEDVDTVVVCHGNDSNNELVGHLQDRKGTVHVIGDCLAPRDAEAAVLEGLKIGARI